MNIAVALAGSGSDEFEFGFRRYHRSGGDGGLDNLHPLLARLADELDHGQSGVLGDVLQVNEGLAAELEAVEMVAMVMIDTAFDELRFGIGLDAVHLLERHGETLERHDIPGFETATIHVTGNPAP